MRLWLVEFTAFWVSWKLAIAEYAIPAQVSCFDNTAKLFTEIR